jgi:hypothetical protein
MPPCHHGDARVPSLRCCENFPHFTLRLLLIHRPYCMAGCRGALYFSSLPKHQRRVWAAFRLCCSLLTQEFFSTQLLCNMNGDGPKACQFPKATRTLTDKYIFRI